ncbi:MAG: DoxX family protein, partial [Acidobacteriota bacterium]
TLRPDFGVFWKELQSSSAVGLCRGFLGLLFLSTGVMKFALPSLRNAFSGQLTEAALPFHSVNMWLVPLVEVVLGGMLIVGLLGRIASFVAIVMMIVATYVHLVVHNPELFPLQPEAPIIPLAAIVLCLYVLWAGSGSWSIDLRRQESDVT